MTLSRQQAEQIFDRVLKYSTAEETEVMVSSSAFALTRFANNAIHQNVSEESTTLSVRVVTDGRMARASTNKLDEGSIREICEGRRPLRQRDGRVEPRHSRCDRSECHQARGEEPADRGGHLFQRGQRLWTL